MSGWLWLFGFIILFLIIFRIILIAYAKSIPHHPDQTPHVIDPNDIQHTHYHSSKQWLSYQSKGQVLSANCKNGEVRMYKKNTNTYRVKDFKKGNRLNFNTLKNVIAINIDEEYADVEGSITFESYVSSVLPYGFIPTVVPELKSITVGGTIVGIGIESSSFKFGLVHESMIECDVLLSNGDVLTCNKHNTPQLFKAIPNSLGSLGYILRARMKIVKSKKYVALRNVFCKTYDELGDKMCSACHNDKTMDFIDGVAYWNGSGRIMIGTMMDALPKGKQVTQFSIFHKYIQNGPRDREDVMYMQILDYLWRWDADMFWTIKNVWWLNNLWIRWYLSGDVMRSDVLRHLHRVVLGRDIVTQRPHQVKAGNQMFINDILVAEASVKGFLKFWFEEVLYIRKTPQARLPMWLCPSKGTDYSFIKLNGELNVNFGFWSTVCWDKKEIGCCEFVESNLDKYQAVKLLYGTTKYTKERFYELFDKDKVYFGLKSKYDKDNKIRHYYEKCTKK